MDFDFGFESSDPRGAFLKRRKHMITLLIIIVFLVLIGVLPNWPHSKNWGFYPSGGVGLILLVLIILLITGLI